MQPDTPNARTTLTTMCLAGVLLIGAQTAPAQDIPAKFTDADHLLTVLETADRDLETLRADVELVDQASDVEGNIMTRRRGKVALRVRLDDDNVARTGPDGNAFRIDFEALYLPAETPGEWVRREDRESYVFDGRELTRIIHRDRQIIVDEIVEPGKEGDPLRIGEGPFPLPIGQRKADILERFTAELLEPADGLDTLPPPLRDTVQLKLVPRRGTDEARDYQEIRIWYFRHDADGDKEADHLLPRMARTVQIDGSRNDARLINIKTNETFDETYFDIEVPPGWEISRPRSDATRPLRTTDVTPSMQAFAMPAQPARMMPDRPDDAAPPAPEPAAPPETAPALLRLLEADYLTDEEGARIRLFHGVARDDDFGSPDDAAMVALYRATFDDISLEICDSIDDRAEALLGRGDPRAALDLLDEPASARAIRLRVEANAALARFDQAAAEAYEAGRLVTAGNIADAPTITEVTRMLIIRSRIEGAEEGPEDYKAMMRLLAAARTADSFYWPARLIEAELLYQKDNRTEAAGALIEVLSLNPQVARAWYLLGRMAVDSFNFDQAESIALRLDRISGSSAEDGETGHPFSAMLRARARLRQRDAIGAAQVLDTALTANPHMPELLALRAAAEATRFYYPRVEQMLEEFDRLVPGSPLALHEIGVALSEARQYGPAAMYLARAHDRMPNWAQPLIDLGLLEMQAGRDGEAIDALEKAYELDPFNMRADNSLRLARELRAYETLESEHFIVRYRPGIDGVLAEEMLAPLERNHELVSAASGGGFDHEPDRKTVIELLPDHEWFGVRIAGMPAIHTIAASTGPVIAMETPREGAKHLGVYDWVRVLRHEYAHTVTLSRTNNRIPHWFTEAAAVYVEFAPRDYNTCQLLAAALSSGTLFDLDKINIAFVRPEKPTDRQQAYAQGHWMYEFIITQWGDRAPLDLMDKYAAGVRELDAFEQVLTVDRDEFMRRFLAWAQEQVISWGLALDDQTPPLRELLVEEALRDDSRRDAILEQLARAAEDTAGAGATGTSDTGTAWTLELPKLDGTLLLRLNRSHPGHPEVLQSLVEHELATSMNGLATRKMIPLLSEYAAARPVDPMPHRLLAKLYLDGPADQTDKAIEHLEFLDQRETRAATYAIELAKRYAAIKDWTNAMAKAERATQVAPYDADHRELAATVAVKNADLQTARRHILALTRLEPGRDIHTRRLAAIDARLAEQNRDH